MRIPFERYQDAVAHADAKAKANNCTWYVNRLASSGPMRYESSQQPITNTSFGGGVVYTATPEVR